MIQKLIKATKHYSLLKTIQKKRLDRILEKAKSNEKLTNKEIYYIDDCLKTIKCHLIALEMNTSSRVAKIRNNPYKTNTTIAGVESKYN